MKNSKLHIGIDFVALISFLYLIDNDGIFIYALVAATIHELGHIIAMKLCGVKIKKLSLGWYGAKINMDTSRIISYKKEIIIAASGPIAGAVCAILFSRVNIESCTMIAGFSVVLTLFNLLPAGELDGGRVIKYATLLLFDERIQTVISKCANLISAVLLITLCIYVSVTICVSPSLCIFCAFVAASLIKELFD